MNDRPLDEGVLAWGLGGALIGATAGLGYAALAANSMWALPAAQRGFEIEARLGGNLPNGFPVIDRFVNGVATSIKSVDLAAKTYQSGAALQSTLIGYVDRLAGFSGAVRAGIAVNGAQITQRVLQVAIPAGRMSAEQRAAFDAAKAHAAQLGVLLKTTVIR